MMDVGSSFAGRYEVLAKIGEGGMGSVYKVLDTELNLVCALKLLAPELVSNAEWRLRFLREGKAMSRIDHRNVARVLRLGIDGAPFLVMEFIDGISLRKLLAKRESLKITEALQIIMQACDGMAAAHQSQVLHRDLKPDNLMLIETDGTNGYLVKVVDFGLARVVSSTLTSENQHLTQTGALIGSAHYMSPEQCEGNRVDERSDVYALGCVLFESLTGALPFDADTTIGVLHKHRTEEIPSVENNEGIVSNADLNRLIGKALSKRPTERYQSMGQFREDVALCLARQPLMYAVSGDTEQLRTQRQSRALAVAVAVVSLCSLLGVLTYKRFSVDSNRAGQLDVLRKFSDSKQQPSDAQFLRDLQQANELVDKRRAAEALKLIEHSIGSFMDESERSHASFEKISSTARIVKARLLIAKARALRQIGRFTQSKNCLEGALIMLASLIGHCDQYQELGDTANIAVESLLAGGCAYQFDNSVFEPVPVRGSSARSVCSIEGALSRLHQESSLSATPELKRNLLRLELPFALRAGDRGQGNYWFRVAQAEVPDSDRQCESAEKAVAAYRRAKSPLIAAEVLAFALYQSYSYEMRRQYMQQLRTLLPLLEAPGTDVDRVQTVVATLARHYNGLWEYDRAFDVAGYWLNRSGGTAHSVVDLLVPWTEASRVLNKSDVAIAFMEGKIRNLSSNVDEPIRFAYMRGLANFLMRLQRTAAARRAYANVLAVEATSGPLTVSAAEDVLSYLLCCSASNKVKDFDIAVEEFSDRFPEECRESLQLRVLDECLRREDYSRMNEMLRRPVQQTYGGLRRGEELSGFIRVNFCWHCAASGNVRIAKENFPRSLVVDTDAFYLLAMFTGRTKEAEFILQHKLKSLSVQENRLAKNKVLVFLALARLLQADPPGARRYVCQVSKFLYSEHGTEVTPITIEQFLACAEGNTAEALRPRFQRLSIATFDNCFAYQKLFMALIAEANGHLDRKTYFDAAKKDLLEILPPTHSAFKTLSSY